MEETYVLIGAELSFFTTKVRSYLDWKGIRYETMLPTTEVVETIIMPMTSILMIPVILIYSTDSSGKEQVKAIQDSKAIMEYFETKFPTPNAPLLPQPPTKRFTAMLLELMSDEWMLVQAMYWRFSPDNIDKQKKFLQYEFGCGVSGGKGTLAEKIASGRERMGQMAGFLGPLGITPDTSPSIRKQFHHMLELLSTHLESHEYLLGSEISVADFALYGPFYAHLSRDPVPGFIIKTEAPLVASWIDRISHSRQNPGHVSAANNDDNIPPTLLPIIAFFLSNFGPLLTAGVNSVVSFLSENPTDPVPRFMGMTKVGLYIEGKVAAEGERITGTHSVWMMQRILDKAYSSEARKACDELLSRLDRLGLEVSQYWSGAVATWEQSVWKASRNEQNQLIATKNK